MREEKEEVPSMESMVKLCGRLSDVVARLRIENEELKAKLLKFMREEK